MKLLVLMLVLFSSVCWAEAPSYLLEIDFGKASVSDDNKLSYDDDPDDNMGEVLDKYQPGGVVSISGGTRLKRFSTENTSVYALLKIKHFKAIKTDHFSTGPLDIHYDEYLTSILVGPKFVFFPSKRLHLTASVFAGYSLITSSLDIPQADASANLESTGLSLAAEAGVEYMLSNVFGLSLNFGYEHLGRRHFDVKSESGFANNAPESFKSQMSYSNMYATAGLRFYFSN